MPSLWTPHLFVRGFTSAFFFESSMIWRIRSPRCRPACALGPPSAEAMLEYGRSLAAAGKDEDAIQQFTPAMKLNPNLPGVQFEMAMALQRLGRQQEAIPWFQKAVERDPHNAMRADESGSGADADRQRQRGARVFPAGAG